MNGSQKIGSFRPAPNKFAYFAILLEATFKQRCRSPEMATLMLREMPPPSSTAATLLDDFCKRLDASETKNSIDTVVESFVQLSRNYLAQPKLARFFAHLTAE